jgi:quercetin dioxygenase-like cupin family protein
MPIEIRRFGIGQRRLIGPPGSVGLTGTILHADGRATVTEVAFSRNAKIEPHSSPNSTTFIVIEGGGWVGIGDEWTRIAAGEAAVWPADIPHAAWTEHSEMRALIVELAGPDDGAVVAATDAAPPPEAPADRGTGQLAARAEPRPLADPAEGEPA